MDGEAINYGPFSFGPGIPMSGSAVPNFDMRGLLNSKCDANDINIAGGDEAAATFTGLHAAFHAHPTFFSQPKTHDSGYETRSGGARQSIANRSNYCETETQSVGDGMGSVQGMSWEAGLGSMRCDHDHKRRKGNLNAILCPKINCEKAFKTNAELRKHLNRHNRPYRCDVSTCTRDKGFGTLNELWRHKRSCHSEKARSGVFYRCKFCEDGKLWPRADNLRSHLKSIHSRPHENMNDYMVHQGSPSHGIDKTLLDMGEQPPAWMLPEIFPNSTNTMESMLGGVGSGPQVMPTSMINGESSMDGYQGYSNDQNVQEFYQTLDTIKDALPTEQDSYQGMLPQPISGSEDPIDMPAMTYIGTLFPAQPLQNIPFQVAMPESVTEFSLGKTDGTFVTALTSMSAPTATKDLSLLDEPGQIYDFGANGNDDDDDDDDRNDKDHDDKNNDWNDETDDDEDGKGEPDEAYSKLRRDELPSVSSGQPPLAILDVSELTLEQEFSVLKRLHVSGRLADMVEQVTQQTDKPMKLAPLSVESVVATPAAAPPANPEMEPDCEIVPVSMPVPAPAPTPTPAPAPAPAPAPTPEAKPDEPRKADHMCDICKHKFRTKAALTKHIKRHVRPYGCTFDNCHKNFGSKNDWKRHELGQHFKLERWKCAEQKGSEKTLCDEEFYMGAEFSEHLREKHQVKQEAAIAERMASCHAGEQLKTHFWCGFCKKSLRFEDDPGNGASSQPSRPGTGLAIHKRFLEFFRWRTNHIDNHFMGRSGDVRGISRWVSQSMAQRDEASSGVRRKSRKHGREIWYCCNCRDYNLVCASDACVNCDHARCSYCDIGRS